MDDIILRASYSLTVTRPQYNDLKGALIIDYLGTDGGSGRRGNPQLLANGVEELRSFIGVVL